MSMTFGTTKKYFQLKNKTGELEKFAGFVFGSQGLVLSGAVFNCHIVALSLYICWL